MPVNETTLASPIFVQLQQPSCDTAGFTEPIATTRPTRGRRETLRDAVQKRQAAELNARAHYLKGSIMVLGVRGVAECAASLEEFGHGGYLRGASALLERTGQALREVEAELAGRLGAEVIPSDKTGAP
jgi:hypothetical protein